MNHNSIVCVPTLHCLSVFTKPPKANMSYRQRSGLCALKNDSNIVIVPTDKGRATVVIDKEDYYTRMKRTLQDDKYQILQKSPTVNRENKIANILKTLHAQGHIGAQLGDSQTPTQLPHRCMAYPNS